MTIEMSSYEFMDLFLLYGMEILELVHSRELLDIQTIG